MHGVSSPTDLVEPDGRGRGRWLACPDSNTRSTNLSLRTDVRGPAGWIPSRSPRTSRDHSAWLISASLRSLNLSVEILDTDVWGPAGWIPSRTPQTSGATRHGSFLHLCDLWPLQSRYSISVRSTATHRCLCCASRSCARLPKLRSGVEVGVTSHTYNRRYGAVLDHRIGT
jgi:hypothetical protein